MLTRKRFLLLIVVLVVAAAGLSLFLLSAPAVAQQPAAPQQTSLSWDVTWNVVGSGGTTMSSSSYTLLSTTGQPIAGPAASDSYTLHSGYWQELLYRILLPFIVK